MLIRPPRVTQELTDAPAQEMTLEQIILAELRNVGTKVDSFRMEMLGSADGETKHGRLPRVETDLEAMETKFDGLTTALSTRVKSLEDDRIRWKAYAAAAAFIGGLVGALVSAGLSAITSIMRH